MTRRHFLTGATLLMLVVAACGGTDTTSTTDELTTSAAPTTTTIPPTPTTTLSQEQLAAAQYEEDVKAIKTLFRRYSDSWFIGEDTGFAYLEDHVYPGEECSAEDYKEKWNVPEGFKEEIIVDESTIERDDGWPIPGGVASGIIPEGRIYILSATSTVSQPGFDPSEVVAEVHATVLDDGTTYFFWGCGKG